MEDFVDVRQLLVAIIEHDNLLNVAYGADFSSFTTVRLHYGKVEYILCDRYNTASDKMDWILQHPDLFFDRSNCEGAYYLDEVFKKAFKKLIYDELTEKLDNFIAITIYKILLDNNVKTVSWDRHEEINNIIRSLREKGDELTYEDIVEALKPMLSCITII